MGQLPVVVEPYCMEFVEFALLNLNCLVCKTSFVNKFQRLAGSGDVVKCKYLPNRCSSSREYDEIAVNFEDFVNALDQSGVIAPRDS